MAPVANRLLVLVLVLVLVMVLVLVVASAGRDANVLLVLSELRGMAVLAWIFMRRTSWKSVACANAVACGGYCWEYVVSASGVACHTKYTFKL